MKTRGVVMFFISVAVLAGLYLVSSTDLVLTERKTQVHNISVLVPDENDECWGYFKKGMDAASIEYNVDVSFVTLYQRGRADQQSGLMLREIENGAQALIICPADSSIIAEGLNGAGVAVPVLAVYSRINSPQVKAYIGANSYNMGESLADAIRQDSRAAGITEVIAVSAPGDRSDIDETYEGLSNALLGSGLALRREYALHDEDVPALLARFNPESGEVIAALDPLTMQAFAAEVRLLEESRRALYGVGCTNSIIRGLEEGAIRAVSVSNGYDAGYLSIKTAVELIERSKSAGTGQFVNDVLVRPENIYDKEIWMMLFPI